VTDANRSDAMSRLDTFLGNRICLIRQSKGRSTYELAEALGTEPVDLRRIERGEIRISAELVAKIADVLEVTIAKLFAQSDVVSDTQLLLEDIPQPIAILVEELRKTEAG